MQNGRLNHHVRCGLTYVGAIAPACVLLACSDATAVEFPDTGRIRVINSVFQGADAASAVPASIDLLIDSSTAAPGFTGLAAGRLADGNSTSGIGGGAGPTLFAGAGYRDISTGVHSFTPRVTGTTGPTSNLYRNSAGTDQVLIRQTVTPFPTTLVLAGLVPPAGTAPARTAVPWIYLTDDPFTPPMDTANGGLKARVRIVNAAPFAVATGTGSTVSVRFTGSATFGAFVGYRAGSAYINMPAGDYQMSVTTTPGNVVLYSAQVTLAKGEVRTFAVVSTAASATPGPGNHTVYNLLDNKF